MVESVSVLKGDHSFLARNTTQVACENSSASSVMERQMVASNQTEDQVSFTKTIVQTQIEEEQVKRLYEEHARILQNYSTIKISVSKSCDIDQR